MRRSQDLLALPMIVSLSLMLQGCNFGGLGNLFGSGGSSPQQSPESLPSGPRVGGLPSPDHPAPTSSTGDYPILFVTQMPVSADFTTIGSTFGNQSGRIDSVAPGGDLYIRYPDGKLKNLTKLAGYGVDGFQGKNAIAVRDPAVDWSGKKAVFSMLVGFTDEQYQWLDNKWQLYEVTGLGENETPVITKVPNQPANYDNVSPIYGTDDRIIFTSDSPRNGASHLFPQLDEYEEAPTVTGLWSLDPASGDLHILNHTPSGAFTPTIDSYGRVIFTRWDHLQRDQQADGDALGRGSYGTFNYSDESANAARLSSRAEVFPEPRPERQDLLAGTNLEGETFNSFFPWSMNEDGTNEETINHIGRHEFLGYFDRSMNDDDSLVEFDPRGRFNPNPIDNFFQIKEDPTHPGLYYGVDAPEFGSHASGQIIAMSAPPGLPADQIAIQYITHRSTEGLTAEGAKPDPNDSGHYREPLPLSNGELVAVHTPETRKDIDQGTTSAPKSRYDFRLKFLKKAGNYYVADRPLTTGITKSVTYWSPDVKVSYSGLLWELNPVEVRPRTRPARRVEGLEPIERQVFQEEGVDPVAFQKYLVENNLALVVSRDVTTRDKADRQQPYNLQVAGSTTHTLGSSGKIYQVASLQFFQADQIRGVGGVDSPSPGRRVLAEPLHDPAAKNPPYSAGPAGSVQVAPDGSTAELLPARRAMTWQLTDAHGTGVVRERVWLTFQPGEMRTCTSCHGINTKDQAGNLPPQNEPQALRTLLRYWKSQLAH